MAYLRKIRIWGGILIVAVVFSFLYFYSARAAITNIPKDYWVWAGLNERFVAAPEEATLYIYQGIIRKKSEGDGMYERIGLYPHPLKNQNIYIVYRLTGELPKPENIVRLYEANLYEWERHGAQAQGLQLDFDAPTAKLLHYSSFLEELRQCLPEKYKLSITGLGDWVVSGDKNALARLTKTTDEVVFQLYQGREPLSDMSRYIQALKNLDMRFRIGLLRGHEERRHLKQLIQNENFNGIIYFTQRI